MTKIKRPFFSYFGSKFSSAKRYPAPAHDTIVEPFAGSAGYACLHHDRKVLLCDKSPVIAGVWDFLIRASPSDILGLPSAVPDTVDDLHVHQEAKWLIGFWVNAASAAPRNQPSTWMRGGLRPGCFWGTQIQESIAAHVHLIKHWRVMNVGYEDIPSSKQATWFVDPPYQVKGTSYPYGAAGIDFPHLADWCRNRPGQAIVCENAGADWLPFEPFFDMSTNRPGGRKASTEALWVK